MNNINSKIKFLKWFSIILLLMFLLGSTINIDGKVNSPMKLHHLKDGFRNYPGNEPGFGFKNGLKMFSKIPDFLSNSDNPKFEPLKNDGKYLKANTKDYTVTWVGHATLLVQMEGYNFLTDPIWSERCSPVSFAGPKRFVKPGIDFKNLPKIDFVLISHDHYDHLDKETVLALSELGVTFYVPLKVKQHFSEWGISRTLIKSFDNGMPTSAKNVFELDWWDSIHYGKLTIHCTPSQHFSGRGLIRNKTLWSSWVVIGKEVKFYFGGDTGYFNGFKEIGNKLGPFDLVAMPIGAYNQDIEHWKFVHVNPEEAVQAYLDLKGRFFVPIHWGTFKLAFHPYDEPPVRLMKEVERKKLDKEKFFILKHGETKVWGKILEQPIQIGKIQQVVEQL